MDRQHGFGVAWRDVYATRVGRLLVLALTSACSFDPGSLRLPDSGLEPDVTLPIDVITPTWSIDATSGKGVPATGTEWTDVLGAYGIDAGSPTHLWPLQETGGPLADVLGTASLTPQNVPTYANPVPGWSRLAVGTIDTIGNQGFITSAAGNLNGTSHLVLVYAGVISPPMADKSLVGVGAGGDHRYIGVASGSTFRAAGAGVTPATGTVASGTAIHPLVLAVNFAESRFTVYTDAEKLAPAWIAPAGAGGLFILGNAVIGAASARYLYAAMWTGAAAELDDSEVKALLTGLGWTVTGY